MLNSNKNADKWREVAIDSNFALGAGDSVSIYYYGYLINEYGEKVIVDGMSNFADANPYSLVLGSGSFVPGFELNMVGLNIQDTKLPEPRTRL